MKHIRIILLLALVGIFSTGCAGRSTSEGFEDSDRLKIVTSIYPMYDFVTQIAGDYAQVINLVPAGTEPHDYELSTGDMELLETADVFVYNGANMEPFVDKTTKAISNERLILVEAAKNVATIQEDGQTDPHTWLSIENAMEECRCIRDALQEADAEHADVYAKRCETYLKRLEQLDQEYRDGLSDVSNDTIVVAHQAFGYLCEEYGLKQEAVEGLTADSEPDSARMKEIIDLCKEKNIRVIFFEELVSPKVAETIADETGAQTMVLNPIEGLTAEQEEEGADYISLMQDNLQALKEALQ